MSRAGAVVAWILQILLGALFILSGVPKLMSDPGVVKMFGDFGYPDGFHLLVGAAEILGGVLLFIPPVAAWGAALLGMVMVGACVTHLKEGEFARAAVTLVLFGLLFLIGMLRGGVLRRPRPRRKREGDGAEGAGAER